jgi:phage recombination protein Bet
VSVPALHSQSLSREQIDLVKRTIANGASNDELQMFLHLADKYSLDPFAKEIHFSKMGGRPSFIVARDGYLKIAMLDPGYNGLQSMVVRKGDHFEIDAEGNRVIHKFGTDRGEILGAWAVARHKQRPPVICFVEFSEYKQASPIWTKYPSAMIQKVAEVFVLRRQFTISGLVSQEEIAYDMAPAESHKSLPLPMAEVEVLDAKGEVIDRTDTSETVTEETTTSLPTPKKPPATEGEHPNKNRATTAITQTVAKAGAKANLRDAALYAEFERFAGRAITTLYDIGSTPAEYQPFLKHLNELGGNADA